MPILGVVASSITTNLGSYYSIASTTVTGSPVSSITFNSVPQDYKSLELRVWQKDTFTSGIYASQYIYFNGDTSGSYAQTNYYGTFGAIGYSASPGATQNLIFTSFGCTSGSPNPSAAFGYYQVQITNYASTTRKTSTNTTFGWGTNNQSQTTYSQWMGNMNGLYNKTDAVTSVSCLPTTQFAVGTVVALYGVK